MSILCSARLNVCRRLLPVVALFVCCLGGANEVLASCGDHVWVNGAPMARPGHEHHRPDVAHLMVLTPDRAAQDKRLPALPTCRGPLCQQNRAPASPPVKVVPVEYRTDLFLAVAAPLSQEGASRRSVMVSSCHGRDAVTDVFHPPKAAA